MEERLAGGRIAGAVRVNGAVHRPARPWTAAVPAVLRHLDAANFAGAPRALGFDNRGREMLTYLVGETVGERLPWPAWIFSDTALAQVGPWTRRLHDATATFVPPDGVTWFAGQTWRPDLGSRRLRLLLDAYAYDGDRSAFGTRRRRAGAGERHRHPPAGGLGRPHVRRAATDRRRSGAGRHRR